MDRRYPYVAIVDPNLNTISSNGNPITSHILKENGGYLLTEDGLLFNIENNDFIIPCDYQPQFSVTTSQNGTTIPVSYKLFISTKCPFTLLKGMKVNVGGNTGIIVGVFKYLMNIEVWVR